MEVDNIWRFDGILSIVVDALVQSNNLVDRRDGNSILKGVVILSIVGALEATEIAYWGVYLAFPYIYSD